MTIVSEIKTPDRPKRRRGKLNVPTVTLAHGGGGKAMRDLIDDVFVGAFDNPKLAPLEDQARFDMSALASLGDRLAGVSSGSFGHYSPSFGSSTPHFSAISFSMSLKDLVSSPFSGVFWSVLSPGGTNAGALS